MLLKNLANIKINHMVDKSKKEKKKIRTIISELVKDPFFLTLLTQVRKRNRLSKIKKKKIEPGITH